MKPKNSNTIEVVVSPANYRYKRTFENFLVVVVDVLRASTSICQAFASGTKKIIPVSEVNDALKFKNNGFLVAGERGGEKLDFADFGNSPLEFQSKNLKSKKIVFTTTNGTRAIETASDADSVVIGGFSNFKVLTDWIAEQNKNVIVLCAGWEDTVSLEDTTFAGALIETLIEGSDYSIPFDSSIMALELWISAKRNPYEFLKKGTHFERLKNLGAESDFEFCIKFNTTAVIPVMKGTHLKNILK